MLYNIISNGQQKLIFLKVFVTDKRANSMCTKQTKQNNNNKSSMLARETETDHKRFKKPQHLHLVPPIQ